MTTTIRQKESLNRTKRRALYRATKYPTEEQEQAEIFDWIIDDNLVDLFWLHSIPNGSYVHIRTAQKLKNTGLKSGVPDLFLPYNAKGYSGLYIELKRVKPKGRVSDNQQAWLDYLNKCGFKAVVCYGFDEAKEVLLDYI